MSEKLQTIVDQISGLSLLEASELVKIMEEKFGVSAQAAMAPVIMPGLGGPGGSAAPAEEAKTEFDVILAGVSDPGKKIGIIKTVREITNLGLKEAKELVESAPKPLKEAVSKAEAEEIQKKLTEAGAKIEIK